MNIGIDKYGVLNETAVFPKDGRIACQGVPGAYSEMAARRMFSNGKLMFLKTFDAVFEAVKSGLCEFGILPIENNTYGSVRAVYDLLLKGEVTIVRGERLNIHHGLLVNSGTRLTDIKEIRSHEQAIGQCSHFLKNLSEDVWVVPCLNTALAAREVSKSGRKDLAAIASDRSAELYHLDILPVNIMDSDNNYTRFICIQKERAVYPGANRISLILNVAHKPGALFEVLERFEKLKINMLKLESRPIIGRDFEFMFYIDIEASVTDEKVVGMLKKLEDSCREFTYLGNYAES